jgi:hypothetical protein
MQEQDFGQFVIETVVLKQTASWFESSSRFCELTERATSVSSSDANLIVLSEDSDGERGRWAF